MRHMPLKEELLEWNLTIERHRSTSLPIFSMPHLDTAINTTHIRSKFEIHTRMSQETVAIDSVEPVTDSQ